MDLFQNKDFIPMLLSEEKTPFDDEDYIFELKFDGTRTLIYVDPDYILIKNRRGVKLNDTYPELLDIKKLVKEKVIFDGEIILMANGKPSFEKLQLRAMLKNKQKIAYYVKNYPVVFVAYDILYEGRDLTNLSLMERKKILAKYKDGNTFIKTKYTEGKGIAFFNETKKMGLEGVIAKHKDSIYKINKRTKEWIKIKNNIFESFYIYGYKNTENGISIMLVDDNNIYVGKVAVNKSNPDYKIIKGQPINSKPLILKEGYTYLKSDLKCIAEYMTRTKNGGLRQPIYRGLVE